MADPLSKFPVWARQLVDDERRRFMHFSISCITFFVGYGLIYWCAENMPPSLQQELTALALVLLTGAAFLWALTMQLLHIAAKIFK